MIIKIIKPLFYFVLGFRILKSESRYGDNGTGATEKYIWRFIKIYLLFWNGKRTHLKIFSIVYSSKIKISLDAFIRIVKILHILANQFSQNTQCHIREPNYFLNY